MEDRSRCLQEEEYCSCKLGIFVHWGPASGHMDSAWDTIDAPRSALSNYITEFDNAIQNFNVQEWTGFFSRIGAKYVSFVVRHINNLFYNLYPSKVFDFCSQRDFMGEIADACKKDNLLLTVYQPLGWEGGKRWQLDGCPNYEQESKRIYQELRDALIEVVEQYNPFSVWFDGWPYNKGAFERAGKDPYFPFQFEKLADEARKVKHNLLLGNKEMFPPYIDYVCSEYFLVDHFGNPISGLNTPTEVTETLPASKDWFSTYADDRFELSDEELKHIKSQYVKRFFSVVGRGMNYLLNVGPLPNGEIPKVDREILNNIGRWTQKYAEAIYGTRFCDADSYNWGYVVQKGDARYLYIMDISSLKEAEEFNNNLKPGEPLPSWMKVGYQGQISLKLDWKPQQVIFMNEEQKIDFTYNDRVLTFSLDNKNLSEDVLLVKVC